MIETQNRIGGIVGRKRTGKGGRLRELLRYCPRFIVFDVLGEHVPLDGRNRFESPAELARFLKWARGQLRAQGASWRGIATRLGGGHRNRSQSGAETFQKRFAGRPGGG